LAEVLGISQTLLNRIEYCKQNPTPELLQKIADYFDEDVESLIVERPVEWRLKYSCVILNEWICWNLKSEVSQLRD